MSCGYIYVVSHPKMGKGERKLGAALHHPFDVTARWERLSGDGRPLRLHSMAFVRDIADTRRAIDRNLRGDKVLKGRTGLDAVRGVAKDRLADAMRSAIAADHAAMSAAFDPHTGLFRSPSERLSGPPDQLVATIAQRLAPHCPAGSPPLWEEPFSVGLFWSMIELQANQLHIPEAYVPEMYRALASRLWGVRPSNSEMRELLTLMRKNAPEYRLGCFVFGRRFRAPLCRDIQSEEVYAQLETYLANPASFIDQAYLAYGRMHYSKLSIQTVDSLIIVARAALLGLLVLGLSTIYLGGGPDGMMRMLMSGFAIGLILFAANFFEPPDAARYLGFISVRDWRKGRRKLERFHVNPSSHSAPLADKDQASVIAA